VTAPSLSPLAGSATPAVWVSLAWCAAVLAAAIAGVFHTPGDLPPVAIGLAVVIPPAVAGWFALTSERFRAWARSLDLHFLTMLQTWRVVGLAFLALAATGSLPDGFAVPAGSGDLAVGVTAPLVALYAIGRNRLGRRIYLGWTAFGALDLVNAVALGVLYSDSRIGLLATDVSTDLMEELPMVLIPAFGVPFTLVLHLISVINLTGDSAVRTARPGGAGQGAAEARAATAP
jgi:hypothetical protein